jgi:hypothetical protein
VAIVGVAGRVPGDARDAETEETSALSAGAFVS